jgi:hypothetical protein
MQSFTAGFAVCVLASQIENADKVGLKGAD